MEYRRLRSFLPKNRSGPGWDALLHAVAEGDRYISSLAEAMFPNLFLALSSGIYLERHAANRGVSIPTEVGADPERLRELAIRLTSHKYTPHALSLILEVFYGSRATRAWAESKKEPFSLQDGDTLFVRLNEDKTQKVSFRSDDFADISNASAVEVARLLTHKLSGGYAEVEDGRVAIYSDVLGLAGSVEIVSGSAVAALGLPSPAKRTVYDNGSAAVVASPKMGEVEVLLPATSEIVGRSETTGWYFPRTSDTYQMTAIGNQGDEILVEVDGGEVFEGGREVEIEGVYAYGQGYEVTTKIHDTPDTGDWNFLGVAKGKAFLVRYPSDLSEGRLSIFDYETEELSEPNIDSFPSSISQAFLLDSEDILFLSNDSATTEGWLLDTETLSVSPTGPLASASLGQRSGHFGVKLADGRVLFWGDLGDPSSPIAHNGDLYDPKTNTFTLVAENLSINPDSLSQWLVPLPDGRVLFAETNNGRFWLWNPVTDTFQEGSCPVVMRPSVAFDQTVGPDGAVIVMGTDPSFTEPRAILIYPNKMASKEIGANWYREIVGLFQGELLVRAPSHTPMPPGQQSLFRYNYKTGEQIELFGPAETPSYPVLVYQDKILTPGPTPWILNLIHARVEPVSSLNGRHTILDGGEGWFTIAATRPGVDYTLGTVSTPVSSSATGSYLASESFGPTSIGTSTAERLHPGRTYSSIRVSDVSAFPSTGTIAIAFGEDVEASPIPYRNRVGNETLVLDGAHTFEQAVPAGASVVLLAKPSTPVRATWVTASTSGRLVASKILEEAVAVGTPLKQTVAYPGDRGLAGEGLPVKGVPRLSDKVVVWGGASVDEEVDQARRS